MKGVFIRNITHEINTPLNSIVGFAELAAAPDTDDEERQSYIEIIRENSGYLQKLVDDVLYIAAQGILSCRKNWAWKQREKI